MVVASAKEVRLAKVSLPLLDDLTVSGFDDCHDVAQGVLWNF